MPFLKLFIHAEESETVQESRLLWAAIRHAAGRHVLHLKIQEKICMEAGLLNWGSDENLVGPAHLKAIVMYLI